MEQRNHRLVPATAGVIGAIVVATAASVAHVRSDMRAETRHALTTVLETTQQAVHSWVSEHAATASVWAATPEVGDLALALLEAHAQGRPLLDEPAQAAVRARLRPVLRGAGYGGFFIISPDLTNLASSRDGNVGAETLLADQAGFLSAVWSGDPALSLPTFSDVPLPDPTGEPVAARATMFIGAPIRDATGAVRAMLAFRIDPAEDFTAILERGRLGATGETYAFDRRGRLVSESGFPVVAPSERPLTRMAAAAVRGERGSDVRGYRDDRGVEVVGAWLWDEELGLGMTTEIDAAEAQRSEREIVLLAGLNAIVFSLLVVWLAASIARRRRELVREHARLRTVLDMVPSRISVVDGTGRFQLANEAKAEAHGLTVEELLGAGPEAAPASATAREAERMVLEGRGVVSRDDERVVDADGRERVLETVRMPYRAAEGRIAVLAVETDVTERRELRARLQNALAKALSGYLPICAACKQIRQEDGGWLQVEAHISRRTDAEFSHTICPGCAASLYGDDLDPADLDELAGAKP